MIWTDALLNQLALDAAQEIGKRVTCLYNKFYLLVTQGVSVYTLDARVRDILRVTWRGRRLDCVTFQEMQYLSPATVFVGQGNSANIETSQSRPFWYTVSPTHPYDIRLYPTPNESFVAGPDPYSISVNEPYCVVSCYEHIDPTFTDPTSSLPAYIARRSQKAYICWKAFEAEGRGQNLKAANYYHQKFDFLVEQFRYINEGAYIGKRYKIEDGEITIDGFRYPKPIMPANFERVIFR